jgi:hypothetical protein
MGLQVAFSMIPQYRKKVFYSNLRKQMGDVFKKLASHGEGQIHDGNAIYVNAADFIQRIASLAKLYPYYFTC